MSNPIDIDETEKSFLMELYRRTEGESSAQASMYDIGETLGLDKKAASSISEALISWGLVEVRTLSGGIGITEDGAAEAVQRGAAGDIGSVSTLGDAVVIDDAKTLEIEAIVSKLKDRSGEWDIDFDDQAEITADLKTIEVQLTSPNPKTAIVRECFRSIQAVLEKTGDNEGLALIQQLLG